MQDKKPYYLTTAIAYPNGPPHIGHAYEAIATDVLARFKRLDGHDVFFLTGTDEHGQKVEKTAAASGKTPKEFCDGISALFKGMTELLDISNDDFIRTTQERHYKASQFIWQQMEKNGDIYLDKYAGWYSIRDEAFYAEDELTDGPNGQKLSPQGTPCEWTEEESYFFRLSAYGDRLMKLYEDNPDFIQPASRRNEIMSFVKGGLRDLSISRTSFNWGVPVPGNDRHVMYVWVDALTNYLTGIGYPDVTAESFKKFWPCDVHIIGKDIIRFHCVYWPAFLWSAGLPLPKRVFAHGFLYVQGEKMSKSLGNVLAPKDMVDRYGLDQFRYFLLREVSFGQDGEFSHEQIVGRINGDLANNLGNLCQRTLSQIAKNCEGKVPQTGAFTDADKELLDQAYNILPQMRAQFDDLAFSKALEIIWRVVDAANIYIDHQAPWKLKKDDPTRMATVLYVLAEVIRVLGIVVQPFVPQSAVKILDQVAVAEKERGFGSIDRKLVAGTALPAPQGVFPRYVEVEGEAVANAG